MSLTVTYGCFQNTHSTFSEWRNEIARVAGYKFEERADVYEGKVYWFTVPALNWNKISDENAYGRWKKTPNDPLVVLLAHSDCEGVIHPEQGIALANRLEKLIDRIPEPKQEEDNDFPWLRTYQDNYREMTKQFIVGLRLAADRGEDVEFLG